MSIGSLIQRFVAVFDKNGNPIDSVDDNGKRRFCVDAALNATGLVTVGKYDNSLAVATINVETIFDGAGTTMYSRTGAGVLYRIHIELDTKDARPVLEIDGVDIFNDTMTLSFVDQLDLKKDDLVNRTFLYNQGGADHATIDFGELGMVYMTSLVFKMKKVPSGGTKKLKRMALWEARL